MTNTIDHTPSPFNADYDPQTRQRYADVTASMEHDGYYDKHSRDQCRAEWGRRYTLLKGSLNND